MDPVLGEANNKIAAAIEHLKREFATIRAGRANPSLIENIPVKAYGGTMRLVEVATIGAPQPTLLTVQAWDAGLVPDIIKAIQEANIGLNPASDGQVIRLPIPPLTAERREEFIKQSHVRMEEVRIQVRQIRQDTREGWQRAQEAGEFGEDEFNRRSKLLQDLVDRTQGAIDELGKQKEAELREI